MHVPSKKKKLELDPTVTESSAESFQCVCGEDRPLENGAEWKSFYTYYTRGNLRKLHRWTTSLSTTGFLVLSASALEARKAPEHFIH